MSYLDFGAAAAAAALSAFEVPGLFEAELKLPNKLVGFGAMMLALGRAATAAAASWGFLTAPFMAAGLLGFVGFFILDVTTIFFVAGCPLMSPSRALFAPMASVRRPSAGGVSAEAPFLLGDPSFDPGFPFSCFLLVDAAALSKIFCARPLTFGPPFLTNLGKSLATFVF